MGLSFNQGGSAMTAASIASVLDPTNKGITIVARIRWNAASAITATNQTIFATDRGATTPGMYLRWDNGNSFTVIVPGSVANGESLSNTTTPVSGTWYDFVVTIPSDLFSAGEGCHFYWRATSAGSAGLSGSDLLPSSEGSGSGSQPALTRSWYFGDDETGGRSLIADTRDLAVFEGVLSAADIEAFGKGYAPIQLTSATLRAAPANVAGTIRSVTEGQHATIAATAMTISGTAQVLSEATLWDGPQTATTAEYGYHTTAHALSHSVGSSTRPTVAYATNNTGNIIRVIDESGAGRNSTNTTDGNRPRFKVASNGDRRIGFRNGPSTLIPNASAASTNNRGISIGFVYARLNCDQVAAGSGDAAVICSIANDGLQVGTDATGAICVRIGTTNLTPLPAVYFQARPMAGIITISDESGTSTRTVTLYTADGTSTVTTHSYASASGVITRVGPRVFAAGRGQYGILKGFDLWTAVLSSGEAATQLAAYAARFSLPTTYSGVVAYVGSSTPEGDGTFLSTCAHVVYQLPANKVGRARVCGFGVSGTTIIERRFTLGGSGTYTEGETVTQSGSSYSGIVVYQNGSTLYVRAGNGATPDTTNALVGGTSGTSRIPSNTSVVSAANHLWTSGSGTRYDRVVDFLNSQATGKRVLLLNSDSNAVNAGWTVADVAACLTRFCAAIKADVSGLRIVACANIPRSGGLGNSHQSYNALLRAGVTGVDHFADYETLSYLNFRDASDVDDDGVYDYGNNTYYAQDNGTNDGVHANELSQAGMAEVAGAKVAAALGLLGGSVSVDTAFALWRKKKGN